MKRGVKTRSRALCAWRALGKENSNRERNKELWLAFQSSGVEISLTRHVAVNEVVSILEKGPCFLSSLATPANENLKDTFVSGMYTRNKRLIHRPVGQRKPVIVRYRLDYTRFTLALLDAAARLLFQNYSQNTERPCF